MHAQKIEFDELVVDTSVILKVLIPEKDSDKAEALCRSFLLGKIRLFTLDFFLVEAVNTLWVKTRRRELAESEAEEKIEILTGLMRHMRVMSLATVLVETHRTACQLDHAAYDAAFLALADARGVPLVTADEKLWRKAKRHGSVLLLRDLEIT